MSDEQRKGSVTGIGGVFFQARDPQVLQAWYARHLGLQGASFEIFPWRDAEDPSKPGSTVWAVFPEQTPYFQPSPKPFMINYRVRNLDALLAELRAAGVVVDAKIGVEENGRFAWIMDPEGNRIELWEPAEGC
jgi:catechol 2,3-dioxygenase-like lactoylglutathione lyase family enzyme